MDWLVRRDESEEDAARSEGIATREQQNAELQHKIDAEAMVVSRRVAQLCACGSRHPFPPAPPAHKTPPVHLAAGSQVLSFLLVVTVLLMWLCKRRRVRGIHETGLSMLLGGSLPFSLSWPSGTHLVADTPVKNIPT